MSTDKERRYGTDLDSLRARATTPSRGDAPHDDDPLAELERLVAENDAALARNAQAYDGRQSPGYYEDSDLFRDDPAAAQQADQAYYADDPRYAPSDAYYEGEYRDPDAAYAGAEEYEEPAEPRRRRSGLGVVAAVLVLAGVGGAAALGYRMLSDDNVASGPPPVIQADSEPLKVAAESGTQSEVPHQNKMIYDRVGAEPAGNANVVGGAEEPVERPPASPPREVSRVIPLGPSGSQAADDPDASAQEPALQPLDSENAAVAPVGEAGGEAVVPAEGGSRRVRTFVIRPDGSMGEAPQAPVATAAATESAASEAPRGPIVGQGVAEGMSMQPGQEFGIMSEGGGNAAAAPESVPLPTARPAGLQTAFAASQQAAPPAALAPTTPAAPRPQAPAVPAQAAATGSGFTVQVTSQRSEGEARQAYDNLQRRFPNILGSYQPTLQPVNIADRGTFYRVRVGSFASQNEAAALCGNLKAAGGDCIVQRN